MIRELDNDGFLLCKIQGRLFENSTNYVNTSSLIFIRRFMNSVAATEFDSGQFLNDTKTIENVYESLIDEYGESEYGSVKMNSEILYWMGYIYRYFSYTYNLSSKRVYKIIKPNELYERYYIYHTFDCSNAIERILEEKNISFDEDKMNERLLMLMRKNSYEEGVNLCKRVSYTNQNSTILMLGESKEYDDLFLDITYKEETVGTIEINNLGYNDTLEISIELDETYKQRNMDQVVLKKLIEYLKSGFKTKRIRMKVLNNDEKFLSTLMNNSFKITIDDDNYTYLERSS